MSHGPGWNEAARILRLVLDQRPSQQNVAAIFEESSEGQAQMDAFLAEAPPEWSAYLAPRLPKIREVPVRYIGLLGNLNAGAIVTAAARNEAELLDGLIPWFVEKLLAKGGLCPFLLGVRDPVRQSIEARLAELQPTPGPGGTFTAPPLLATLRGAYGVQNGAEGLPAPATPAAVDLMHPTAVWGGRFIAPDRIAYPADAFAQDADDFQTGIARTWLTEDKAGLEQLLAAGRYPLIFEAMPSGVLRVTGVLPSGATTHIEFDVGEWLEDAPA